MEDFLFLLLFLTYLSVHNVDFGGKVSVFCFFLEGFISFQLQESDNVRSVYLQVINKINSKPKIYFL